MQFLRLFWLMAFKDIWVIVGWVVFCWFVVCFFFSFLMTLSSIYLLVFSLTDQPR